MAEDQRFILGRIADIVEANGSDAVVIAGDIYDRAVPIEEVVFTFGDFLERVTSLGCEAYIVAGNHDSGTRLEFCRSILSRHGVHVTGEFIGRIERIVIEDEYGPLNIYLPPYFKVSEVRARLGADVSGYGEAMLAVLEAYGVSADERNLLVAHQFFVGVSGDLVISKSKEQSPEVRGIKCIAASTLDPFDYVALGHLHIPQSVGRETVMYSSSPLKYSASEHLYRKEIVLANIRGKGNVSVERIPLEPLRDLRVVRRTVTEIISAAIDDPEGRGDYTIVDITEVPVGSMEDLRKTSPHFVSFMLGSRASETVTSEHNFEQTVLIKPDELFAGFYKEMTGDDLTEYQVEILRDCIYSGGEGE